MSGSRGRVLVVDDDRDMCDYLRLGLGRHGFEVEHRTDGAEALRRLGEARFDVVVSDINMRGLNGIDLCERIVAEALQEAKAG